MISRLVIGVMSLLNPFAWIRGLGMLYREPMLSVVVAIIAGLGYVGYELDVPFTWMLSGAWAAIVVLHLLSNGGFTIGHLWGITFLQGVTAAWHCKRALSMMAFTGKINADYIVGALPLVATVLMVLATYVLYSMPHGHIAAHRSRLVRKAVLGGTGDLESADGAHGDARFMTEPEMKQAFPERKDGKGLVFAVATTCTSEAEAIKKVGVTSAFAKKYGDSSYAPLMMWQMSGHGAVWAGAGGTARVEGQRANWGWLGKTSAYGITNGLYHKGSAVFVDPKNNAEIREATIGYAREVLGLDCYSLDPSPFADAHSADMLEWVINEPGTVITDCQLAFADVILDPTAGSDSPWEDLCRNLGVGITAGGFRRARLHGTARPNWKWIGNQLFAGTDAQVVGRIREIVLEAQADAEDMTLPSDSRAEAEAINKLLVRYADADLLDNPGTREMWDKTIGMMGKYLGFLKGDPRIVDLISGEGAPKVPLKKLLDGKTRWYINIPADLLKGATAAFFRISLGAMHRTVTRSNGAMVRNGGCFVFAEEAQQYGPWKEFHEVMLPFSRSAGWLMLAIFQSPEDLDRIMPGKSDAWLDTAQFHSFFALGSEKSAKRISDLLDKTTLDTVTGGSSSAQGSLQTGQVAKALLTVGQVRSLPPHQQIVLVKGCRPMLCAGATFFLRPEFRDLPEKYKRQVMQAIEVTEQELVELQCLIEDMVDAWLEPQDPELVGAAVEVLADIAEYHDTDRAAA